MRKIKKWSKSLLQQDLLIPQNTCKNTESQKNAKEERERKGAFFTPRKWVELSQQYLADYLGINWQDEYYI